MNRLLSLALPAALFAVCLSDSLGGFCARAAVLVPLAWAGIIDGDTASQLAVLYH
ncbi:hypothetical protein NKJ09_22955 [Mesorhizobium sp. M0189]|uniref:hypothetical protein n=1 Tax=Mesorhizobium sp. M0189 TaxID=2956909 RepID=UPI0033369165